MVNIFYHRRLSLRFKIYRLYFIGSKIELVKVNAASLRKKKKKTEKKAFTEEEIEILKS